MGLSQCMKGMEQQLSVDNTVANKIFKAFWEQVVNVLSNEGTVTVDGIGTFTLEKKPDSKKTEYFVKFTASESLKSKVII